MTYRRHTKINRFLSVLGARNREFLRDRTALAWNIVLPVMLVMGFAFAFSTDSSALFTVGIWGESPANGAALGFLNLQHIQFLTESGLQEAITKVERHQLDMLLDLSANHYWINNTSSNGYVLEQLLQGSSTGLEKQTVIGDPIRYVDWLIPGVLGMNIMFSSLFGIGYVIVRYRKNGVLKRLKATPLTAFEFLSAQVASRLWMILVVTVLVYAGTDFFIGFRMYGNYLTLLLILVVGTLSMISLGLIIAARMANEEAANGLLNLISWPMMMLSGVWFSLEGSPQWVHYLAQLLPLTHLIGAARSVMIDGASLMDVTNQLAILAGMTVVFITIGAKTFRWE